MAVFLGGLVAAFFGFIGIIIWWKPFLQLLAGAIPVGLLLGGALAAYLGYDEVKDKLPDLPFLKKKSSEDEPTFESTGEVEKYKEEAEKYKKEAEELRKELEKAKESSS